MRLAIVTHNVARGDGQGRVSYEVARHALRLGYQVTLLANRVDADLIEQGARWEALDPRFKRPILLKVHACTRAADRTLDRLQDRYDAILGFGYTLTRPHTLNSAQFVHHAWLRSPMHIARGRYDPWALYQRLYTTLNARWERRAYDNAGRIIASSNRVRTELIAAGQSDERIRVVYNGVDLTEFQPGKTERGELGLPIGVPLALFVGDIRTERKNLGTALRALEYAPSQHLAVVGSLANSPFPALAQRLGVADRVHFLGYRRDVARIMQAVDLYVFPSRYEPFGMVVLEALASGKPVVTAATVGAAEIVTPECGIVLSDPNDARALGQAMAELIADPARLACAGHAAREVASQYGWPWMAQCYLDSYEGVVS